MYDARVRTIKMPEVVGETLRKCSSTLRLDKETFLNSLALIAEHDEEDWQCDHRRDDREGAKAPWPPTCSEEGSSSGRANERSDDIWGI